MYLNSQFEESICFVKTHLFFVTIATLILTPWMSLFATMLPLIRHNSKLDVITPELEELFEVRAAITSQIAWRTHVGTQRRLRSGVTGSLQDAVRHSVLEAPCHVPVGLPVLERQCHIADGGGS